jgi:hypothetical protein
MRTARARPVGIVLVDPFLNVVRSRLRSLLLDLARPNDREPRFTIAKKSEVRRLVQHVRARMQVLQDRDHNDLRIYWPVAGCAVCLQSTQYLGEDD